MAAKEKIIATYTITYEDGTNEQLTLAVSENDNGGKTSFMAGEDVYLRLYTSRRSLLDLNMVFGASDGTFGPSGGITSTKDADKESIDDVIEFNDSRVASASYSIDELNGAIQWLGGSVNATVAATIGTTKLLATIAGNEVPDLFLGLAQLKYYTEFQPCLFAGGGANKIADMVWVMIPPEELI